MHTSPKMLSICLLLVVNWTCFALMPSQAQTFGNTPITIDNASDLTLMATYQHMFPPVIALSPDARWLAVGRSRPEGGGPGAGDGLPPYHAPFEYYDASAVLVYDMQNLTDPPQLLTGNNRYIKQMMFTDSRLLILTSDGEEDQRLQSWQIEGGAFVNPQILVEDIDTAFAVDQADSWMVYFYDGGIYYTSSRKPPVQLGLGRYSGSPEFDHPISLHASTLPNDRKLAVAVDQNAVVTVGNLDRPGPYLSLTGESVSRGLGRTFNDGVHVLFADDTMIKLDVQVATFLIVDVTPDKLVDFAINPDWSLIAAIVTNGDLTELTLWDIRETGVPTAPPAEAPILTIPRENLKHVVFSADGTKLITVAGFEIAIWSVPENLLTPNAAFLLSQQNILAYCNNTADDPQIHPQAMRLGVVWSWYASEESLVRDHIYNARYDVRIDGFPLYHWTFVSQIRRASENDNDPTVYFYTPIDTVLSPREHHITYELTWLNPIEDGYATFGSGTENPDNRGECYLDITG